MAKVEGVSGSHQREKVNIPNEGPSADAARKNSDRAKLFEKPDHVDTAIITYNDGKKKFIETRTYKSKGVVISKKRRVVCITKGGKVLSGKLPEGQRA